MVLILVMTLENFNKWSSKLMEINLIHKHCVDVNLIYRGPRFRSKIMPCIMVYGYYTCLVA